MRTRRRGASDRLGMIAGPSQTGVDAMPRPASSDPTVVRSTCAQRRTDRASQYVRLAVLTLALAVSSIILAVSIGSASADGIGSLISLIAQAPGEARRTCLGWGTTL